MSKKHSDPDDEYLDELDTPHLVGRAMYLLSRWGTKHGEFRSMSPHSLATLMAVRMLSPVHMTVRMPASLKSVMTGVVVSFNLFSKTMKPRKLRLDSACSLDIF